MSIINRLPVLAKKERTMVGLFSQNESLSNPKVDP